MDAKTEEFEQVSVLGKQMLFTNLRIDRDTVPEELYLYEVRHDDEGCGDPVQIGTRILVNHWGTLISRVPLPLVKDKYSGRSFLDINPQTDWDYNGSILSLQKYMQETEVVPGAAPAW